MMVLLQGHGWVLVAVAHFHIWPLSKNLLITSSTTLTVCKLQKSSMWTKHRPFVHHKQRTYVKYKNHIIKQNASMTYDL